MSSNPWITRVETVKRQTRAAYGCLVVRLFDCRPIGCTPFLSVTQKAPLQLRYAARGAIYTCKCVYAFAFAI